MIDLLIMLACLAITGAVVWRLATLPLPASGLRNRGGHGTWVAAHVLMGAGALTIALSLPSDALSKHSVLFIVAGVALLLLGRWRRRAGERESIDGGAR